MSKDNKEKKSKKTRYKNSKKPAENIKQIPQEYSFSHIDENKEENPEITKDVISSKTKTAVIIMLVCLLSVIMATGWNYLAPDKIISSIQKTFSGQSGDDFPTMISGTKVSSGNFQYSGNNLTYVSDTSLISLNKSAGEVINRPISFSQPALKISGGNILTYNINGIGFQVDTASETKAKDELENAIIQGDIAENGTYGFITNDDGYLSKLVVFNSENKQIFTYSFSDYYATSLTINKNGTKAAVTTVTSKNGDFFSVIYILDFSSEEPVAKLEEKNSLFYDCDFMDNGSIAVIGDNQALMIKSNYTDIDRYNYDGLTLTSFSFDSSLGGVISLSPSSDGGNCHIVYLNKNGSLDKITDTEYRISSIDLYGNRVAALCDGGSSVFFGTDGEETGKADSGLDGCGITMCGENSIYVLGVSEIREASAN